MRKWILVCAVVGAGFWADRATAQEQLATPPAKLSLSSEPMVMVPMTRTGLLGRRRGMTTMVVQPAVMTQSTTQSTQGTTPTPSDIQQAQATETVRTGSSTSSMQMQTIEPVQYRQGLFSRLRARRGL